MFYDLQKASLLKRASAWLLDMILLCILVVGVASLMSGLLKYDSYYDTLNACKEKYEAQYGVSFEITEEDYKAKSPEEQAIYDEALAAMNADEDALKAYNMLINLSLVIVTISVLAACLVLEFAVPLLFGNGQTVGKKVFGLAIVRVNCVKVDGVCMFIRSILGKYTIETMVPVMLVIMVVWNILGIVGPVVIALLGLLQLILLFATQNHSVIHDCLANTVVVDLHSQMIFGSESELIDYKKRIHEDLVNRSSY